MSATCRGTLLEVRDMSRDPLLGSEQVGMSYRGSVTGRGTLPQVRDVSGYLLGGSE